jgi:voltage-gated potassium channel|tara:strand:+ start:1302 stop:1571 length:270 start_codon:yes stop_codon:yes gene_type:complete
MLSKLIFNEVALIMLVTIAFGQLYSLSPSNDFGFKRPIDPYYYAFSLMSTAGGSEFRPTTDRAKSLVMVQYMVIVTGVVTIISQAVLGK